VTHQLNENMKSPNPSCNPLDIANLVRGHDESAMDRIAECYMGHLMAVGRCACRDESNAPDAVQEAFLAATERLSQFRGDGSVKAWMSKMVVNACRCHERGRKNDPSWNLPIDGSPMVAKEETPVDLVTRTEFLGEVSVALQTLSEEDRELFVLSQLQDISAPELGEVYGRSSEAIRARLTRIRRKLREKLSTVWDEWSDAPL
jgi:RNA polymerase sigma-70 factor (ECF subfamily)